MWFCVFYVLICLWFDVFISKCLLCLVLYFVYVSRFNWCIKRTLDLLEWNMELEKQKKVELTLYWLVTLGMTHDRDQVCRLIQSVPTRSSHVSPKHCNFSSLSSFRILAITSFKNIQMRWFKLSWKHNLEI